MFSTCANSTMRQWRCGRCPAVLPTCKCYSGGRRCATCGSSRGDCVGSNSRRRRKALLWQVQFRHIDARVLFQPSCRRLSASPVYLLCQPFFLRWILEPHRFLRRHPSATWRSFSHDLQVVSNHGDHMSPKKWDSETPSIHCLFMAPVNGGDPNYLLIGVILQVGKNKWVCKGIICSSGVAKGQASIQWSYRGK